MKHLLFIITFFALISCNQSDLLAEKIPEEPIAELCDCSKLEEHFYEQNGVMVAGDTLKSQMTETDCDLDGTTTTKDVVFNGQLLRTITTVTCIPKE